MLPTIDLRSLAGEDQSNAVQKHIDEELNRPFDLTSVPLIRWTLLRLEDTRYEMIHVEHHLVHDGWSFNLFLGELIELYRAYSKDQPHRLSASALQYADYAIWERKWLNSDAAANQIEYWKSQLKNCPAVLELPYDRPRPSTPSYCGAAPRQELSGSLSVSISDLSHRLKTTPFSTMLAAFAILLHRWSGQVDFCIGSGIANRGRREVEEMIGMFVNNVVLRTDISGNPTFHEFLGRVGTVAAEAAENQDIPFDRVVNALQPTRDSRHNPLFQIMFSFHDSPMPKSALPDVETRIVAGASNSTAKFDINVVVIPHSSQRLGASASEDALGLTVIWEYASDLFDQSTIERMMAQYELLLKDIVADPSRRISDLSMTTEEEQRLFAEWNDTATEYPRDSSIGQLFEEWARRTPEATAVEFESQRLSYRELNSRANRLAHYLREAGAGREAIVALCVDRSIEMVVGVLGVIKAGCAYAPIDPMQPPERLNSILRDSGASIALTQNHLADRLPANGAKAIRLDGDWRTIGGHDDSNPNSGARGDSLAYVMYTSGSTGKPKGALIEHRSVARLVKNTNFVDLGPRETILQFASMSFDAATFEVWGALLNGAKLVVFPAHLPSLGELGQFIREQKISTLWLTAAMFHLMVDIELESLSGVRQLLAGGDVLSPPHVRKVLDSIGEGRLINGYGPTEGTTFTTCHVMGSDSKVGNSVSIGRPISNTSVYVVDDCLHPAPLGSWGELCIGGDGVARGYLNRDELTKEKFAKDPFCSVADGRLYRTGDVVRWRRDGTLEFQGRVDLQVKIRGFRVELGEIEVVLGRHPHVSQAAVRAVATPDGDKRLIGYVEGVEGLPAPTTEAIRAHLRRHLPDYMAVSTVIVVDRLPMTTSGKIDRAALPDPIASVAAGPKSDSHSDTERKVRDLWRQLLSIDEIGGDDDFFRLGGDSLLAIQLIHRVDDIFGIKLRMIDVFEFPTISTFAARLDQAADN
jgi:aspartate racemase